MIKAKNKSMAKYKLRSDYDQIMGVAVIEKKSNKKNKLINCENHFEIFNHPTRIEDLQQKNTASLNNAKKRTALFV
jgi:hypothetical protein